MREMYTVLRVTGSTPVTQTAATAINAVSPGTMTPRTPKDGYGAAVEDSNDWDDHVRAIEAFVVAHREALAAAAASGAAVQFDTAIEPDDPRGRLYTSFGCPPEPPPRARRDRSFAGTQLVRNRLTGDSTRLSLRARGVHKLDHRGAVAGGGLLTAR